MRKLSGTSALAITVVVVLLIAVVGWVGLVSPQRSKSSTLDTQIAAAQSQLTAAQHTLAATNTRKNLAVLRAATRALPDTPQMSEILRELAALTAKSQTELDSVTPSAALPGGAPAAEAVPLAVTVKGRYFALQHLLALLRQSADVHGGNVTGQGRLYTVDQIQFGAAGTGTGSTDQGAVTATITLNAFIYDPAAVAAAAAATAAATTTTTTSGTSATSATGATP
jgi:hypothetical protein